VYVAEINHVHYTFEASGSLWQDALVIRDLQTGSLWSQISGTCISGPMEGTTLVQYPLHYTTYGVFKKSFPKGQLLKKEFRGKKGSYYDSYFSNVKKLGILGRIDTFTRLGAKETVYGIRVKQHEVAVSKIFLTENPLYIYNISDQNILIYFQSSGETVIAFKLPFSKKLSQEEFQLDDRSIFLSKTNTRWNILTGQVLSGPGKPLQEVPVISAFWFAWVTFFPETDLIQ